MDFFKILKGGVGVGMSNFDRLFAEKHGGEDWQLTTLTGTLPLSFKSKGTPLTDYKLYGTSDGAGVETENLFDKSTALTGYEISGSSIAANPLWFVTDYIKVDPQTNYIASTSSWGVACLEYASKEGEPIRTVFNNITGVTTLSTTQYIRLNGRIDSIDSKMIVQGSTAPTSYIPYGYKIPMTVESGEESTTTPIYIGDSKLMAEEYVDYESGKVYRDIDGVLTPTDLPVALPELSTYQGENMLSCSEGLGEVSITGYIKGE